MLSDNDAYMTTFVVVVAIAAPLMATALFLPTTHPILAGLSALILAGTSYALVRFGRAVNDA